MIVVFFDSKDESNMSLQQLCEAVFSHSDALS